MWVLDPYPLPELQAIVVAHRRAAGRSLPARRATLEVGALTIDHRRKQVRIDGSKVVLTPKLYDLLGFLAHREGEVVSRDALLEGVWGIGFDPSTNTVDVYVHYLRRALRPFGLAEALATVRGRGYMLDVSKTSGDQTSYQSSTSTV